MKKLNGKLTVTSFIVILALTVLSLSLFALNAANTEPTLTIYANNISFSEALYIKYAVFSENVDKYSDVKLLVWTEPQEDYLLGTEQQAISPDGTSTIDGKKCLIFDYKGISAKKMTDYVYARAVYEKNGKTYYSDVRKYSILTYAYNKFGYTGTATQNADLYSLLEGLLEYGASAQTYFDYKSDALATDKHVKITLENGVFSDGCNTTLALPGTKLTVIAPESPELGGFAYWMNEKGDILSDSATYEITAGLENSTLSAVYNLFEGGNIEGAGANLANDSFAMTFHPINEDNISDVTAAELEYLIEVNALDKNDVFRVTDGKAVAVTAPFNGNGAALIVPNGITISGLDGITVSNLKVSGYVTLSNAKNVTLTEVDIESPSTALKIENSCAGITVRNCRIVGTESAIISNAANTTVRDSYLHGSDAVIGRADGFAIHNSKINAKNSAVTLCGEDVSATNNTIVAQSSSIGITVESNSLNSLVTYNVISGAKTGIKVESATNTVVLFNSLFDAVAEDNTNLYIVENSLGGSLVLKNNNYLLADANSYSDNGKNHTPVLENNENINGDTLMDVTARNEVGAKEELLPHTNKELFLDMERKSTVKDIAGETAFDLNTYVENNAKEKSVVIVPPGAYATPAGKAMTFTSAMSNTEIYAFGVYNEHDFNTDAEYLAGKGSNHILYIGGAKNLVVHGITLGYNYQSSGQVHVLKKLGNNEILVVPAAGYDLEAGFGQSNPDVFSKSYTSKYDAGNPYSGLGGAGYTFVSRNDDGTLILKLNNASIYNAMDVGDIMTCRMAGDNQHTVGISNSTDVKLKDVVFYGYSAALMTVVTGETTGASLERVHNSGRAPFVIDKETYDMYAAWEKEYNVDLEIYIDEEGRYRGSLPRVGSVDATHASGSAEGLDITSCLFENMCDDGSNQRGSSSRLAGVKDNGDGTTTLYFKGMVTSTYHSIYKQAGSTVKSLNAGGFSKGDNIYVYTSNGELVCDTLCLTNAKEEDDLVDVYDFDTIRYYIYTKSVTVSTDAVNFDALEGYDLKDNHYSMVNKVLVDNINHVSQGFVIDNLMVHNSTARGVLVKTVNATVKNSTFRNVTSTGNLLSVETSWGESTVARNIVISGCLFDNTGFDTADAIRAPIAISGLSTYGKANVDTLRASNILITGCEFKDYGHNFGIYVNGAQDVRIYNNVFDPEDAADPGQFIKILTALNVDISGNKYRAADGTLSTISNLDADDYTNIHGSDVGDRYKSKCDIYVGDNHLSSMRVFYANRANRDIASILAENLADICGYSVSYSNFFNENVIKLATLDQNDASVSSETYTVTCEGKDIVITAATRSSLIYAVEDFTEYIRERSKTEQTITFDSGFSMTRSFDLNTLSATNTSLYKYSGLWRADGATMTSLTDADYVEFDVTGGAFTLLFADDTEFDLYIDGKKHGSYTADSELTFYVENGTHTVKVLCKDTSKTISFAGIRYLNAGITRTANKSHYIQFIGDSMIDDDKSFAHTLGNTLEWDYSVMVGDTLPSYTDTGRKPDIVFIFLGTDAIKTGASDSDKTAFAEKYKSLVQSIISKYGSSTKIHLMQALSTSDASAMFDTNHVRYKAIELAISKCASLSSNIYTVNASTVKSWGVEFDASNDATNPTPDGYDTLVINLAKYISSKAGYTDYYNHSFNLSEMKNYNGKMQTGLSEDGISFSRYNFIDKDGNPQNGHVFISGNDYANRITTDSGRYLIFKFRSSADYDISFNMRTNDYGTNVAESGKGYVSTVSRTAVSLSTDWEVAVIDLAQFAHYTTGVNIGVQVRITTTASEIDIANVTIVDTISDANLYILSELGDAEYYFYERWDEKGVRTSITGKEYAEEEEETLDLSFVNHNFNLIVMKQYDNATGKLDIPAGMMLQDEDGTVYDRFVINGGGHAFFKGSNVLSEINGDTGNYLVFKYRSKSTYLQLEMQTSDLPYNTSKPNETMVAKVKPAANVPDGWEVAVVDLSQYSSYTRDADLNVLIRITTSNNVIDISYAALVDDIAEAERYIKIMGDTTYVQYTNWAGTGTSKTIK